VRGERKGPFEADGAAGDAGEEKRDGRTSLWSPPSYRREGEKKGKPGLGPQ